MASPKGPVGAIAAITVAAIAVLASTAAANARDVVIEIRQFQFAPAAPEVRPGDVVIWINKDIVPHTVTAKDESWDSGKIDPDARWRMEVDQTLFETYFCRYHPAMIAKLTFMSE